MDKPMDSVPMYVIPPLLCLVFGVTLAAISVIKGKLKAENILFSLVCIWWSMIPPMFILHHFIKDMHAILVIERAVHFFYVFIVPINILFYFTVLNIRRRWFVYACFAVSALLALTTQSEYYIRGFNTYRWGYIAKGGIAFQVFGVFALVILTYGIILCLRQLRLETNQITRRKIGYILFSINLIAVLTLLNIPSIVGIDLYPAGNFIFVPLSIMGYGVLRYRLMDIRSILHITLIWVAASSAIIIPNAIIFLQLKAYFPLLPSYTMFLILAVWFFLNYFYFRRIQPLIDQLFNKRTYNLRKLEMQFVEEMSFLKGLGDWLTAFEETVKKAVAFKYADVFLKVDDSLVFRNMRGGQVSIDASIEEWFNGANHLVEKNMVETNPYYSGIRNALSEIFAEFKCMYIVPLVQNHGLIGLVFLGEKASLKELTADEVRFINNIRSAAAIALSNSIMYQNLNNLKENLEAIVAERTVELQTKNNQMTFELKVAKDVQKLILSPELPDNRHLRAVAWIQPLMEVSGDFYDVIMLDGLRAAVTIVDVSGHGVPSALLTSMIKSEIHTQVKKPGRTTAEICNSINAALSPTLLETGFFFTMFLCIIDLERMRLEYTNCGHTAAFLVSPGRQAKALWGVGFLIGAAPDTSYDSETVKITEGHRLYLYTDGITESRNSSREFFSEARLIEMIKETRGLSPADQLAALKGRVEEFQRNAPGSRKDDMTLVIAEIGAPVRAVPGIRDALRHYKSGEYRRAAEIIDSLEKAPSSPSALYFAARVYFRAGDLVKALGYIERALGAGGMNLDYLYLKGTMLIKSGRKAEAREVFHAIYNSDRSYKNIGELIVKFGV
jgi:serine phosphatase RsbU (regulator of sigma subunit)